MKKYFTIASFVVTLCSIFTAIPAGAQALLKSGSDLNSVITGVMGIFSNIIPVLVVAAMVVFLWGVVVFIFRLSGGDAESHKKGKELMVYGIIGLVVMVSVWGLVSFVTISLGTGSAVGGAPQFNSSGQ